MWLHRKYQYICFGSMVYQTGQEIHKYDLEEGKELPMVKDLNWR